MSTRPQSDRPFVVQGVRVLIGVLLLTLAYGTLGFFLLDRQYSTPFSLPGALLQTLAMFFTADNASLQPTSRFGRFFANSIYNCRSRHAAVRPLDAAASGYFQKGDN